MTAMGKKTGTFGEFVREIREKRNMSQVTAAELSGITRGHLSDLERGVRPPTIKVAYYLGCTLAINTSEIIARALEQRVADVLADEGIVSSEGKFYVAVMFDTERSVELARVLADLTDQGCSPGIYRRGSYWRAHVNCAGNFWSDGRTPLQALRFAIRLWEYAGKPKDGR